MVHNAYGATSGEEVMFNRIAALLSHHGHEVHLFLRSSQEIIGSLCGKVQAFLSGVYSPASRRQMGQFIRTCRPDVIQIQNLYPLISPSVLLAAREHGIPVVMRCANYRLICPNGLLMSNGKICRRCCGGREWWCLLRNCEDEYFKSLGYALRGYVARKRKYFLDLVTAYYAQTEFQKATLTAEGYSAARMSVIPNIVEDSCACVPQHPGSFVAYAGRISREKGILTLLQAAAMHPEIPFKAAGSCAGVPEFLGKPGENFQFEGHLSSERLGSFYSSSRLVVLPSIWFEGFPNVLLESMIRSKPVIASRLGGLPEIVEEGVTGLLFEPGNPEDLAEKIQYLWERPDLCRDMGRAGRQKALREYSPERYYERLMAVYRKAMESRPEGWEMREKRTAEAMGLSPSRAVAPPLQHRGPAAGF